MPTRVFGQREMDLLQEVLQSGALSVLGGGTMTRRFEAAFARAVGAKHGVAMNAAMSVLHASVFAAGAGAGSEVICDPVCVFGAVAAMYHNAIPVFVDIDPYTMNMDPAQIEARITERTRAIIVTHVWGMPAEMDRIVAVARKHGLLVIEDCAHALLATYQGKHVGTWGDIGSFSFQMSKQLGLGDGGMGVTNSDALAEALGLHGGAPTFTAVAHGLHWNYRMTEQTAAIGIAQLERAPAYVSELIAIARLYEEAAAGCSWLIPQRAPEGAQSTYHFWAAGFWGDRHGLPKEDFQRVLAEEGCQVTIGYTNLPAYKHPLLQERWGYPKGCPLDCPLYTGTGNRYPDGLCPVAEEVIPRMVLVYTFSEKEWHQRNAEALARVIARLS